MSQCPKCGRRVNGVEGSVLWICPDDGVYQPESVEKRVVVRRKNNEAR